MSTVLPPIIQELNYMQNSYQSSHPVHLKDSSKDFENIEAAVRSYKREYSLPTGVNWDVVDFTPYLNFDENNPQNNQQSHLEVTNSREDRIVPGEEQRQRSESISSVTSSMDDKTVVYQNMGIKTYSTVCVDSGSTCISSNSYLNLTSPPIYKDLESEETFQNLNHYLSRGPEVQATDTISSISSASSPLNDNLDYSVLSNFSAISNNSNDSYSNQSISFKRSSASPDTDFLIMNSSKHFCDSPDSGHYQDVRKKNNIASKHCRKTRKEKQKEMETKVTDLEKEREDLKNQIRYLETATALFKKQIHAIMKPSNGLLGNGVATASVSRNILS